MIVDELILKLKADISDVEKRLKEVEGKASAAGKNAGAEMGKTMGTSFGDVFSAIAGAAVLNTVKNFYSRAAAEFNKFEAAFLRVDSIAKGFGRSVDVARKNVDELAQKGFLNLNQAASSYADAIALGFDEKQARKFIDALSDVSAFQNTIGDGAAAVQSGLSGLLSNSAEKVENIGVPIKVLNMAYNENIKTMGKAAALQKFYAGVLKESEKFSGDAARAVDTLAGAQNKANAATDKAMVAIGKGLEPILKKFYNVIEDLASGFAKWFGSLNEGTKTAILFGAAATALVPAIAAVSGVLSMLALNPVTLTIMALVAAFSALVAITAEYNKSGADIVKGYKEQRSELTSLTDTVKELEKTNKRTLEQEKELVASKDKLRAKAKELGLDYDMLVKKLGGYEQALKAVDTAEKMRASGEILKKQQALDKANKFMAENPTLAKGLAMMPGGISFDKDVWAKLSPAEKAKLEQAQKDVWQGDAAQNTPAAAASTGAKLVEQRFLETSNKIAEIEKNREQTLKKYRKALKDEDAEEERQRRIKAANEDADLQIQAELNARRQAYAEFIEDKYMADTEALKRQTDDAIRASNEILEAGIKEAKGDEWEIFALKEDHEERLQKIRETNARKQSQITLQSFAETANAANAVTTGLSSAIKSGSIGGSAGGAGGIFSGLATGLGDQYKSLGIFGQGIAAVGGAVGVLSDLFGKSDADRAREAAQQKQRDDEAKALLELQANYQKSMLALQEAAAKLPFENLTRQLRLIDIESQKQTLAGGDADTISKQRLAGRLSAMQGVLSSQAGAISGNQLFGDVGATPDELINFLSNSAALRNQLGPLLGIGQGGGDYSAGKAGLIEQALQGLGYSGSYDSRIGAARQSLGYGLPSDSYDTSGVTSKDKLAFAAYLEAVNPANNLLEQLLSEFTTDTGIAENLLSVIEQSQQTQLEISGNTKKTADNTAKALELRPDRERSFIDVGQGFIQSLGQRITSPSAIGIARSVSQNLTIPTELGAANVITGRARTLQERMADALETQIRQGATANDILRDIRAAAVELLAVMDGNPNTGASMTMNDFVSLQSEANRRRV